MESALVCRSNDREKCVWYRRWHDGSRNQCCSAQRLYLWLSFPATFGRRISRSIFQIAGMLSRLRMCDLFQPTPHALGLAEFVLGRFHRSLRAALLDGSLDRLANRLSLDGRSDEAVQISPAAALQRFN